MSGRTTPLTEIRAQIRLEDTASVPIIDIFDEILDPSDTGRLFTLTSGVAFDRAVATLTNGIDDSVAFLIEMAGELPRESQLFGSVSLNGIDLAGYLISGFSLFVDEVEITPLVDKQQSYIVHGTWSIEGSLASVPEPATIALFGVGLVGLGMISRRQRG